MRLLIEEKQKKEREREKKILGAKYIEERKVSLPISIFMPG